MSTTSTLINMSSYPPIKTIAQIDSSDPSDYEAASQLAAAQRQVRQFLIDFLGVSFNSDGTLKAGSVGAGDAVASGSVRGHTGNAGSQREVLAGSISTLDLRADAVAATQLAANAVTTVKLLNSAVNAAKLATDSVETNKIKDGAVVNAKLGPLAVDTGQLAALAVEAAQLGTNAVSAAKIAALAVTPAKLSDIGQHLVLVGNGSGVEAASIGGAMTATLVGGVLTFALAAAATGGSASYARVEEQKLAGASMGANVGGTWEARGGWQEVDDAGGLVTISGNKIIVANEGTYAIRITVPAYSVGTHRCKVVNATGPVDLALGTLASAPPGTMNTAFLGITAVVPAATEFEIHQWTEITQPGNGKGLASGEGVANEIYTVVELIQLG